jgi:hypothetical protein
MISTSTTFSCSQLLQSPCLEHSQTICTLLRGSIQARKKHVISPAIKQHILGCFAGVPATKNRQTRLGYPPGKMARKAE